MNHAYRLVYNDRTGHHVPAPETSRARGKSSGGKAMRTTARATLAGAAAACCTVIAGPAQAQAPAADALPTGGQVVAGQAIISQPEAARMLIDQGSDRAIIDWQQFDIGSAAAVHFQQPSADSAALNRVIAGDASQIHGQLSANGQVWLVNPNGVLFGEGSRVDVGGLVTSTLNITNQDFLDGKAVFERDGATGSIINQGTITAADGGLVALLAPTVVNDGIISARMGHVVLAAGEQVTLDAGANGLLQVAVDPATVQTLVENRQLIVADGGQAIMTGKAADALAGGVVANTGTVQARTLAEHNGRILLLGDMDHGTVAHSGVLDASAPDGGDGGFIDTSAATVRISQTAQVTTHAPQGQTGTWLIDPSDFTIAASGGDITGAQLSTNLAGTSIEIQSSGGDNDGQGDIHVNDAVNWNTNTLTLTAARDININAVMTAGGDSKLVMNTGTANGGDDAVTDGRVRVGLAPGAPNGFAGRVDFPDRSGTGFLTINGAAYHVLGANDLGTEGDASNTTLQGIRNNLGGKYALGAHIDASATATWNSDGSGGHYGFTPIGENFPSFTGHFDGLGHVVEGLYINRTGVNFVGMFGTTRAGAIIRNVGVTNADVAAQSYVGALLGQIITSGQFHNIHSSGTVRGSGSAVAGLIGGGSAYEPLYIGHAYSSATVSGPYYAAGVVGELSVDAPTVIEHAGASGTVNGNNAGGLLGRITNYGSTLDLRNLYSTAMVIAGDYQSGSLAGSIGSRYGGTATLRNSFASGSAPNLFGRAETYGDGTVTFSGVFWDTDQAPGFAGYNGGVSTAGAVGLTTAQMRTLANYNSATEANGNVNPAWDISGNAGDDTIWRIYDGDSYPVLRAWQTAPIVTAHDDTTVYNGNAYSGGTGYTAGAPVTGTPTWGGDSQGAKNAGNYTITLSGLSPDRSTQRDYQYWNENIVYRDGALTITPAALAIAAKSDLTKVYGNTYAISADDLDVTGLQSSDRIDNIDFDSAGAAATAGVNGGTPYDLTVSNATGDNFNADNYTITYHDGKLTITPRDLTIAAKSNLTKTYGDIYTFSDSDLDITGLQNGDQIDSVDFASTGAAATASVNGGTPYDVTVSNAEGTFDAGNYTITYNNGALTITPAALAVTAKSDLTKTYGDTYTFSDSDLLSVTGLKNSDAVDSVVFASTGAAATAGVNGGTPYDVTVSNATGDSFDAGNYTITYNNGALTITPAALAVTAKSDLTKTYGDTYTFSDSDLLSVTGLKNSDKINNIDFDSAGAAATASVNGGTPYAVTVENATGDSFDAGNYTITYNNGALTISPKALTVTAKSDLTKVYGETYAFSANDLDITGLQNGETIGNADFASAGATATASVNGGTPYDVTVDNATGGTFNANNYTITYHDGALTITPAALTVTALDAEKTHDDVAWSGGNGIRLDGLVNNETQDVLSGTLAYGGNSQGAVDAGRYQITPSGLSSDNYVISFLDGVLTIRPSASPQEVPETNPTMPSGGSLSTSSGLEDQGTTESTPGPRVVTGQNGTSDQGGIPYLAIEGDVVALGTSTSGEETE